MQTSADRKTDSSTAGAVSAGTGSGTGCNCFTDVNVELAKSGGELLADWLTDPPRVFISTHRKQPRKKLPLVQGTFCPFCGKKYPPKKNPFAALASAKES